MQSLRNKKAEMILVCNVYHNHVALHDSDKLDQSALCGASGILLYIAMICTSFLICIQF